MLSQLSKGYGSWTAGYVDPYFGEKKERECTLPEIDSQDSHFHGVTIGSRSGRSTAMSWATSKRSREPTIDGMPLPKTYTTRKGALQLFVGPDDLENDDDDEDEDDADNESYPLKPKYQIKRAQGQELIDLSLKLGTMERLAMSVLQFGDEDYDHEHTSVTDTKNKAFLKFIQSVDEARTKAGIDSHVQPGGDLKSYLKDLKTSAGSRFSNMYVSKSRESLELQAILRGLDNSTWPISYSQDGASEKSGQFTRPVSRVSSRGPSPGPPSTPRSSYQVLSAKKVAASIKSGSYLGRPSSRISAQDDDLSENEQGGAGHLTPASALRPTWTPTDSTDDYLIDTRDKFYQADDDGDSSEDGRKRRRFKERSFLTNNSQLYQVDEIYDENASEIRSTKSGKSGCKSQSKRIKSVLESEDGGDSEYKLPVLDSDKMEEKDAHAIASELDALGLKKGKKGIKTYTAPPPGPRPKAPQEKQKIPDHLQDALNRRASQSRDYLEQDLERRGFLKDGKVTAMVGETLSGPTLEAVGEGLTEEELEIAKQLLQQKLDEAKGQLDGKPAAPKASKVKKPAGKGGKKGKKKNDQSDEKTKEEMDREAIRAKRDAEQQLREQEAADLQRKIAENKRLLQQQADQTSAKSKELLDEMERLEREAADMQRAEDEARQMLADERKKQREERDARRKADLERKKQEAMDRREREKKELEEKRRKENEMMEKIADAEMRRRMREEEERRIDEEERLAQERYEAEMREAQRQEEEDEERLKEMERQAEEEAMQRLIEEREAAERERRRIREEEEAFREAEAIRLAQMAEEHKKLEEERARLQAIEDAKREAERQNLLKLRQMEEEARAKMQEEIEKRRADAMARRDFNLENKQNVDKLRHYQGLTRAWTFSYFVQWPRETYESRLRPKLQKGKRPFGAGDPRKTVKINNPPPKAAEEGATAVGGGGNDVPTPIVP